MNKKKESGKKNKPEAPPGGASNAEPAPTK
jgi:hypothetical protein